MTPKKTGVIYATRSPLLGTRRKYTVHYRIITPIRIGLGTAVSFYGGHDTDLSSRRFRISELLICPQYTAAANNDGNCLTGFSNGKKKIKKFNINTYVHACTVLLYTSGRYT